MKINIIQHSIEWLNPLANREKAENYLKKSQGADVCFFSEMFTTGFCMNPRESSESQKETLRWMQDKASTYNIALGGSVAVEENGLYYNRFYFVRPDGSYESYDKHHLFTFAGEHHNYTKGEERLIVEYKGVRFLLLVCYDLRFPVWSRNRGDYDVLVCVANWPKPRRNPWDILLRARAIENLCYVAGVNIVGSDPNVVYSGGTAALDFLGNYINKAEDDKEGIVSFTVELDKLNEFRQKFPALNDADEFEMK